jgi:putative ATP-binding cassette transporter
VVPRDPAAGAGGAGPADSVIETVEDAAQIAYEGLTLRTPKEGRALIHDLWVQVPRGRRLLITGPNGSGRTSLLRATAGLWTRGEGRIIRPPLDQIVFLPSQPFLEPGTLRDQLLAAAGRDDVTDEQMREVLVRVGFEPALKRAGGLCAEGDWPSVLSLSEQQLLAFAGLLLANPRFAFLDEATSAVDPAAGRELYRLLRETSTTYVSVATDPALLEHHDLLLEIAGGGVWQVVPRHGRVLSAAG